MDPKSGFPLGDDLQQQRGNAEGLQDLGGMSYHTGIPGPNTNIKENSDQEKIYLLVLI